jgi:hypothetical protein
MKRLYLHRSHAIDVSVEAQCPAFPTQDNRTTTTDYIAILTIYSDESTGETILGPVRVERTTEHVFASEAEALMGGFSEGRRLVDHHIENDETSLQNTL